VDRWPQRHDDALSYAARGLQLPLQGVVPTASLLCTPSDATALPVLLRPGAAAQPFQRLQTLPQAAVLPEHVLPHLEAQLLRGRVPKASDQLRLAVSPAAVPEQVGGYAMGVQPGKRSAAEVQERRKFRIEERRKFREAQRERLSRGELRISRVRKEQSKARERGDRGRFLPKGATTKRHGDELDRSDSVASSEI
jgi:hypothetical protein